MKWLDVKEYKDNSNLSETIIDITLLNSWVKKNKITDFAFDFNVEDINRIKVIKNNRIKSLIDLFDHKQLFKNKEELFLIIHSYYPKDYIEDELKQWCNDNKKTYYIPQKTWYKNTTTIIIKLV